MLLLGTNTFLLWSLLPVAILVAGIAPAVSFAAGDRWQGERVEHLHVEPEQIGGGLATQHRLSGEGFGEARFGDWAKIIHLAWVWRAAHRRYCGAMSQPSDLMVVGEPQHPA